MATLFLPFHCEDGLYCIKQHDNYVCVMGIVDREGYICLNIYSE